ncbi:MAG: MFS transporter [Verrucomicrobia bacterium]|nr:MFS transporter [Verrucomicrobiota bacterium]
MVSKNISKKLSRMQFASAFVGNLLEHYDTALFSFLSPFLAPLIFPDKEPLVALLLTYAIIPLGMLARPLGSLVFGYIGDKYGRGEALFLTLTGMAIVSGCIALTPTYKEIGVLAPILFCLGRILQNFLSAGETVGGAIFLLENSEEKKHDFLSGLYSASTIGGILLASLGVFLLSYYKIVDFGWRLLYLFGCLTALFGSFIRRHTKTTSFKTNIPLSFKALWTYRKPFFLIALAAGFSYANYIMALVLMNGFIPLISPLTKMQMMSVNTALLVLDFCALPLFGYLAYKIGREKMMLLASASVTLFALPLCALLKGATLLTVIGVRLFFVVSGVAFFAPFYSWSQKLLPLSHRYMLISFAYAVGSQLLGGPTAAISLLLFKKTGWIASVGIYWMGLAVLTSLAIIFQGKNHDNRLSIR